MVEEVEDEEDNEIRTFDLVAWRLVVVKRHDFSIIRTGLGIRVSTRPARISLASFC